MYSSVVKMEILHGSSLKRALGKYTKVSPHYQKTTFDEVAKQSLDLYGVSMFL